MIDPTRTADHATHTGAGPVTTTCENPPAANGTFRPASTPRYVFGEEIARGGMGAVYRATDTVLNREVAIKVLQERFAPNSSTAARFFDEARITAQLQHPAIPPIHDLGTLPDGRPFLAMKLIKGRTLDELLKERSNPASDRGRFLAIFEQLCQAVGYAHAHRVIHRDLKPANVMVGAFGEVQVMDWGLAKVLDHQHPATDPTETTGETEIRSLRDADGELTQAGSVLGTPAFMPPEQAAGAVRKVDARSDVFGLGAVLAVVLTGKPPFAASSAETTRVKAAQGQVEECFARLDACGADPELVALCKRCLAPKQETRPPDAGEVAHAVAELRQAADERARQAELDRVRAEGDLHAAKLKADEARKRRRVQMALAATLAILLVAGGAFAWWQDRQEADRRAERDRAETEKQAIALRQQLKDEQLAISERERVSRNTAAVAALLGQCEDAIRLRDAEKAALALGAIEKQANEGGADNFAVRIARCRADLGLLQELDQIDQFRWSHIGKQAPEPSMIAARCRTTFAAAGLDPASAPPAEVVRRLRESLLRDGLVTALDLWLTVSPGAEIQEVLRVLDPDPFRDAIRDATAAGDGKRVAELAGQEAALTQPADFATVLGQNPAVARARQRTILEVALRTRPNDFSLLMTLGHTFFASPDSHSSDRLRWYQAAVAAKPRNLIALNNLGIVLAEFGRQPEAIAYFQQAIRINPNDAQGHYNLGLSRFTLRELDAAEACFRETIRLLPDFPAGHANLGQVLQARNDLDGAISCYRESIRLDPKTAGTQVNLGMALRSKGDLPGAIACLKEAVRLDPKLAAAHYNLGNALGARRDIEGAIASFKDAIQHDPNLAAAHHNLGVLLAGKGNLDDALVCFKEAVRLDPKDAKAQTNLGLALDRKGDVNGAAACYKEAIRLNPNLAPPHNNLGMILSAKDDLDGAIACFQAAIRADPTLPQARVNLGLALIRKEDLDGAIASFKEAARLNPNDQFAKRSLDLALKAKAELDAKRAIAPLPREVKRP